MLSPIVVSACGGTTETRSGVVEPLETETDAAALSIGARCSAPSVTAGGAHTCLVRPTGTVACWGSNATRQLGTTLPAFATAPADVPNVGAAIAAAAGTSHTCALLASGTVTCWGANTSGQLGNGTVTRNSPPTPVAGLSGIMALAASSMHTCALRNDGTVWCWGSNGSGRLGDGTTARRTLPVQVLGLSDVKAITAGSAHTCALTGAGAAYCWGSNSYGQVGDESRLSRLRPVAVHAGEGVTWRSIAAGTYHTCGVLQAPGNGVRCWGRNALGALGDGTTVAYRTAPAAVTTSDGAALTDGVMVTAGGSMTCVVRGDGTSLCWGANGQGQLGQTTVSTSARLAPVAAPAPLANGFLTVAAGGVHTCALDVAGDVFCWGANGSGQLGDGTRTRRPQPVRVGSDTGLTFNTFASEDEHTSLAGAAASGVLTSGPDLLVVGRERATGTDAWVVRRSRDRGASWTALASFTFAGAPMQLPHVARSSSGGIVLAGVAEDEDHNASWVTRLSSDGGETWSNADVFMLARAKPATLLGLASGAGDRVYAAGSADDDLGTHWLLRASTDGGATWFTADDYSVSGGAHAVLDSASSGLFVAGHVVTSGHARLRVRHTAAVGANGSGTTWTDADDFQYAAGYDTFGEALAEDMGGRVFVLARALGADGWRAVLRVSADHGATWQTASTFQLAQDADTQGFGLRVDRAGTLHLVGSAARAGSSARGILASSYDHGATWVLSDELSDVGVITDLAEDSAGGLHTAGTYGVAAAARWSVRSRACVALATGCGNWVVEPGETCDGNCSDCNDHDACTTDLVQGSPAACNVSCTNTPITSCASGDGCCPAGCTSADDLDCCTGPIEQGACVDLSFRVDDLAATGCSTVETLQVTGTSRGALAVSSSAVLYTGALSATRPRTARFAATDLSQPHALNRAWDNMFSDLRSGSVYVLGYGTTPVSAPGVASTLIPIDPMTGNPTASARITLSRTIRFASTRSFFSGYGRLLFHNGTEMFDVQLPSGQVTNLGSVVLAPHNTCAASGAWGVAESFGGALYVDYAAADGVRRTRVPEGTTTTLAAYDLGDTCAIGVSPTTKRWYFHHAGASQFATGSEILGACPATLRRPNAAPVCGSGLLEAAETCDGDCPTSCDDGDPCTNDVLTGAASTCNVACGHEHIPNCTSVAVDECANGQNDCSPNAVCTDTPTHYTCACAAGFSGDGRTCTDLDECTNGTATCSARASCANTSGSYTCTCASGFAGDGRTCVDVDECALAMDDCADVATCTNTVGSFTCACNAGYTGDGVVCQDVDECLTNHGGCDALTTCTNLPGGFVCGDCPSGFAGTGLTGCADIDECQTNNGGCFAGVTCTNTVGSRTCGSCPSGFTGDGVTCTDVNECATNNGGCGTHAHCINAPGSFSCACDSGWSGDGHTCVDVNECATNNGGCGADGICVNTAGSFECTCGSGFNKVGNGCVDVDECATNHGGCNVNADCTNLPGSFACACRTGYLGNGVNCSDVDECATHQNDCSAHASCTNTVGSFTCTCGSGYAGDGRTCTDVDECANGTATCDAHATCTNVPGTFTCACNAGYAGTGVTCSDVNECANGTHDCSVNGVCTNTSGGFTCACAAGFTGDGRTCTDVDECTNGTAHCDAHASCQNTPGSYICVCNAGYSGSGTSCTLDPPGSITRVSGSSQTIARQTTSAPLVVQVLSPSSAPMSGYGITFSITSGSGSLDAHGAMSSRAAISDASGLAQVAYTAGSSAGSATILADDGAGHTQTFTVAIADFTPLSVTVTPLRAGVATALAYTRVDPVIPSYLPAQFPPAPITNPTTAVQAIVAASAAVAPTNTTAPGLATSLAANDNVSTDENVSLRVTASFAPNSQVAACMITEDSVPALAGQSFPDLTSAAPTQTLTVSRSEFTQGTVSVRVTATDAAAGPLDSRVVTLNSSAPTVRQVVNINGQEINMGSAAFAPYGTDQVYLAANNGGGFSKLYQYRISTNSIQQISNIRGDNLTDGLGNYIGMSGSDVYFTENNVDGYNKLFKYDGVTVAQVSNTCPGNSDSVSTVVPYNGGVVFTANNPSGSQKLWWTNGGATQQVSDTYPGGWDGITSIRVYNGAVYFNAQVPGSLSRLMRWDGTSGAGSVTQIDGPRDRSSSDNVSNLMVYGSSLYFQMADVDGPTKLFRYDGTTLTPITNTAPAGNNSNPVPLIVFNSKLYFYAIGSLGYGKLFSYDATTGTVAQISDTHPGANDNLSTSFSPAMIPYGQAASADRLYFTSENASGYTKLYQWDGATVTQVPETCPGWYDSPGSLVVHNGALFYSSTNASRVAKAFRYDGSTVTELTGLNADGPHAFSNPRSVGGQLVFWARGQSNLLKLWHTDGTSAPAQAPDTSLGSSLTRVGDNPAFPVVYDNALYFRALSALGVAKFHRYTTAGGVSQVVSTNVRGVAELVTGVAVCHGRLYFGAPNTLARQKLWQFDGTTTRQITDINPTSGDSVSGQTCYNGVLYFSAYFLSGTTNINKLFSYDGTTLRQLTDIQGGTLSDGISSLMVWNGALYFRAYQPGTTYSKLFRYDGSTIVQVSNICGGTCDDYIYPVYSTANYLYVTGAPNPNGWTKLLRYDGSTFQQVTNFTSNGSDSVGTPMALNGRVYFTGWFNNLSKLFADDGTTLTQVSDVNPGSSDNFGAGVVYNGKLWVSASAGTRSKLFSFDGTTFTQVLDLNPTTNDNPSQLGVYDNALFFSATRNGFNKLHRLCEPSAGCTP